MGPREVLNKLKWHPDFTLERYRIVILHRGAPRNRVVIQGSDILDLGSGFRILKVVSPSDEVVWKKSLD